MFSKLCKILAASFPDLIFMATSLVKRKGYIQLQVNKNITLLYLFTKLKESISHIVIQPHPIILHNNPVII